MKTSDLFTRPIINLTSFASIDVSKFLHAANERGEMKWTFTRPGGNEWTSIQRGRFNEAARAAVKEYCLAYGTKFARLILTGMEPVSA